MRERHGSLAALGFGLGFTLAGAALLLQELDLLVLRWSYVLPLILLIVGFVLVASGLISAHRVVSQRPYD